MREIESSIHIPTPEEMRKQSDTQISQQEWVDETMAHIVHMIKLHVGTGVPSFTYTYPVKYYPRYQRWCAWMDVIGQLLEEAGYTAEPTTANRIKIRVNDELMHLFKDDIEVAE